MNASRFRSIRRAGSTRTTRSPISGAWSGHSEPSSRGGTSVVCATTSWPGLSGSTLTRSARPSSSTAQMKPYVGPGGERVMAHPLSRRAHIGDRRGTVGDYLVQDDEGAVDIVRRDDFRAGFTHAATAVVPLVGEVRQALRGAARGRLLRPAGGWRTPGLELRSLGETLLAEPRRRAGPGGHAVELAEKVNAWLGTGTTVSGFPASTEHGAPAAAISSGRLRAPAGTPDPEPFPGALGAGARLPRSAPRRRRGPLV